jgi:hypothetical protein
VRKNFRRIAAVGTILLMGGLAGSAALALPGDENVTHSGPGVDLAIADQVQHKANNAYGDVWDLGDSALGLGGVRPGPLPGPTPGIHPQDIVNGAQQTVAAGLDAVAQGLGGVRVGPLPGPTPGIRPSDSANGAIQAGANGVEVAANTVRRVEVDTRAVATAAPLPI